MEKCKCGSYAVNIERNKENPSCDVCHWRLRAEALLEVAKMAVESQGWSGSDPDENRWTIFYNLARTTVKKIEKDGKP